MKDDLTSGWTLAQPEAGHLHWTSPTGRTYRVGPTPADYFPPLVSTAATTSATEDDGTGTHNGGPTYPDDPGGPLPDDPPF